MKKTIIIAEAGVNHNGDIERAYALIDAAANAGADYVKFQTYITENLVSPDAKKADYQIENTGNTDSQFEMLKQLEIPFKAHNGLKSYAESKGIRFLSTGFDDVSLDFLNELGMDFFKIPSGEAINYLYLKKVASFKKPIVLSTGMCTYEEVKWSLNTLNEFGIKNDDIIVLHCNSEYPSPTDDLNLLVIPKMARDLKIRTGFSDHSLGIEASVAAVALGACVIEKHFTLDRNLPGPDHLASLEPNELKTMISQIRNIELALGDENKKRTKSEEKNLVAARKGIYYKGDLNTGKVLTFDDIYVQRPNTNISAIEIINYLGKELIRNVKGKTPIKKEDFK